MVGEGTKVNKVEINFIFTETQKPLERQGKDFTRKGSPKQTTQHGWEKGHIPKLSVRRVRRCFQHLNV